MDIIICQLTGSRELLDVDGSEISRIEVHCLLSSASYDDVVFPVMHCETVIILKEFLNSNAVGTGFLNLTIENRFSRASCEKQLIKRRTCIPSPKQHSFVAGVQFWLPKLSLIVLASMLVLF